MTTLTIIIINRNKIEVKYITNYWRIKIPVFLLKELNLIYFKHYEFPLINHFTFALNF